MAIRAEQFAFNQAKAVKKVHNDVGDLIDDGLANAGAEVTKIVLTRNGVVETGQLSVAPSLVAVVQIAAKLGVIGVLIDFGGHFEKHEAGRVIARTTAGAVGCRTQGAGEAQVQGGTDEPAEATVDVALRRQGNGMGGEFIVRQPAARGFGKRGGEGLSVLLIERLGMGNQGIEVKGRELLWRKR